MKKLLIIVLIYIAYSQITFSEYEKKTFEEKLKMYVKTILIKNDYSNMSIKAGLSLKGNAKYISNIVPFSQIDSHLNKMNFPKEVKNLILKTKIYSSLSTIDIKYTNFDSEKKEMNDYIGIAFSYKDHIFYGLLNSNVTELNSNDGSGIYAERQGYVEQPPECWGCPEEEEKKMIEEYERRKKEKEEKEKNLILNTFIAKSRNEMKKIIDSLFK